MRIEGVSYTVNWRKVYRGYSFFVPCIDHTAARQVLASVAKRLNLELITKVVVENGIKGLRVWRV